VPFFITKRRRQAPFFIPRLPGRLGKTTLVTRGSVFVDQAFARCTIEQSDRRHSVLSSACGRALERGAKRGFLGAVADGSRARFPHVLFG
jgi:hypothetical protein